MGFFLTSFLVIFLTIKPLNDGRWGAVEIKVGGNQIEEAAENLLKLKNKVDLSKIKNETKI